MPITYHTPLVVCDKVTKLDTHLEPPALIFDSMSFSLPTDRKIAILGRQETGRTTLLLLLQGRMKPDSGQIVSKTNFSMMLNSSSFLHAKLTGIENIISLARIYDLDKEKLTRLAVTLTGLRQGIWFQRVGDLENNERRAMEAMLAAMLPYDCYLVDDIEKLDRNAVEALFRFTAPRNAGMIFTTFNFKIARQYGDCAGVIANKTLYLFNSVNEAEAFYDR